MLTETEIGTLAQVHAAQLSLATREQCVLYTFNVADFYRLHTEWLPSNGTRQANSCAGFRGFEHRPDVVVSLKVSVAAGGV